MVPYIAQRQAEGLPPTQQGPAREGARPGAAGAHYGRDRPAMKQRLSLCFLLWQLLFITSCLSLPVPFLFLFFFSPIFIFGLQFIGVNWVLSIFPQSTPLLPALPGNVVPVSWTGQGVGYHPQALSGKDSYGCSRGSPVHCLHVHDGRWGQGRNEPPDREGRRNPELIKRTSCLEDSV